MQIERLDFVAIPSRDAERARAFYGDTLGLRPDEHAKYEFWAGGTCLGIWEPDRLGGEFAPQRNGHLSFQFLGETLDTGVCHMAFFRDPDGNDLMLHGRYKPYE